MREGLLTLAATIAAAITWVFVVVVCVILILVAGDSRYKNEGAKAYESGNYLLAAQKWDLVTELSQKDVALRAIHAIDASSFDGSKKDWYLSAAKETDIAYVHHYFYPQRTLMYLAHRQDYEALLVRSVAAHAVGDKELAQQYLAWAKEKADGDSMWMCLMETNYDKTCILFY